MKPKLPFIPGSEFSGKVIEIGRDVRTVAVGDPVCAGTCNCLLLVICRKLAWVHLTIVNPYNIRVLPVIQLSLGHVDGPT